MASRVLTRNSSATFPCRRESDSLANATEGVWGKWNQQPGSLFHNLCLPRQNTDKVQHNGHIRRKRGSEGSTPVQGLTGQPKH